MSKGVRNEKPIIISVILLALFFSCPIFAFDQGKSSVTDEMGTRGIGGTRSGYGTGNTPEEKQYVLDTIGAAYDVPYRELVDRFLQVVDEAGKGAATFPELNVEVDLLKQVSEGGGSQAVPIIDGDDLTQRDNYKIQFQCSKTCYVYIVQLDSMGKMDPIFPGQFASRGNPLTPASLYSLPSDNYWFYLDENVGKETIYIIVSRKRRTDIESIFKELSEHSRTIVQQNPVSLKGSYVVTRGIGGTRKGGEQSVSFQNGTQGLYSSTQFRTKKVDFVITRWFQHR